MFIFIKRLSYNLYIVEYCVSKITAYHFMDFKIKDADRTRIKT